MQKRTRHGLSTSPEYRAWEGMIQRCETPQNPEFHRYGARGITVCPAWRAAFLAFYADMGPRPSAKYSLDRIDSNGSYTPDNCRWATNREQNRNMRSNRYITYQGVTQCVKDWADAYRLEYKTLLERLDKGIKPPALFAQPTATSARRLGHYLTHDGLTLTCAEWARKVGISPYTLFKRLKAGWPISRVLASADQRGQANRRRTIIQKRG